MTSPNIEDDLGREKKLKKTEINENKTNIKWK